MPVAVSVKKNNAYVLALGGGIKVKAGGQYVAADSLKVKGNGVYAAGTLVLPANTVLPAISGLPNPSATLTCVPGTWTGSPAPVITRNWYEDATPIAGAIALTYVLPATLVPGKRYTCVETGSNSSGSARAVSNGIVVP